MCTLPPPIKIVIPAQEPEASSLSPEQASIADRLSRSPTTTPEALAKKNERGELLAKLHMEAVRARAARANERVAESHARKLRLEAAKVAKASDKIEHASYVADSRKVERESKREQEKQKREALFAAVREAREARQTARTARQAALAHLEMRASTSREKAVQGVADKGRLQVKHAHAVAEARKAKELAARAAAGVELSSRLGAADARRHERRLAATAHALGLETATKSATARRWDGRVALEEKRRALAREMDLHVCRREARLGALAAKAAAANARVDSVVSDVITARELRPRALHHTLCARLNAAEVNRHLRRALPAAAPTAAARAPPSVAMTIPVVDLVHRGVPPVPPALLARLLFTPRLLSATAKARHAAAAGRRTTLRHLTQARAAHLGTVRVAEAGARRSFLCEVLASVTRAKAQAASVRAYEAVRAVAKRARKANGRVLAAKMRVSAQRIAMLDGVVAREERRNGAARRHAKAMEDRQANRYDKAAQTAARARRASLSAARAASFARATQRLVAANGRRAAHLSAIAERAKAAGVPRAQRPVVARLSLDVDQLVTDAKRVGLRVETLAVDASTVAASTSAETAAAVKAPAAADAKAKAQAAKAAAEEATAARLRAAEARAVAAIEAAVAAAKEAEAMAAEVAIPAKTKKASTAGKEKGGGSPLESRLVALGARLAKRAHESAAISIAHRHDDEEKRTADEEKRTADADGAACGGDAAALVVKGTAKPLHPSEVVSEAVSHATPAKVAREESENEWQLVSASACTTAAVAV